MLDIQLLKARHFTQSINSKGPYIGSRLHAIGAFADIGVAIASGCCWVVGLALGVLQAGLPWPRIRQPAFLDIKMYIWMYIGMYIWMSIRMCIWVSVWMGRVSIVWQTAQ